MPLAIKIITWSLIGAILGFALVYGGFAAYYRAFEPMAADDIRAWQGFIAMTMGGVGAGAGFLAGLVFGIIRRRAGK